jgi:hypothetical protein
MWLLRDGGFEIFLVDETHTLLAYAMIAMVLGMMLGQDNFFGSFWQTIVPGLVD